MQARIELTDYVKRGEYRFTAGFATKREREERWQIPSEARVARAQRINLPPVLQMLAFVADRHRLAVAPGQPRRLLHPEPADGLRPAPAGDRRAAPERAGLHGTRIPARRQRQHLGGADPG